MGTNSKEYNRQYHAARPPEKKAQKIANQKMRVNSIKSAVKDYLAIHTCTDCPETDPIVMEFDHIADDKVIAVSNAVRLGWSLKKVMYEISKCEVVCANEEFRE
jgi:hypothetical protein